MNNVVLTPHIGGATYDTEANHSKLIADDVARILAGEKPVNCVNPEVLCVMAGVKGTADEIKAELLWVAQESLRTNLVHGTAGNFSARLPDGNVVLTPSSLAYETMTLDDLVVCDLDGNVLEGERQPDHREDAAPRVPEGVRRHPRRHPLPREVLHDVRADAPADPVRDRRGRGRSSGGDVPVANYKFTGSQELADEVSKWVGDRAAVLMANHGLLTVGKSPKDALKIANLVELTAEIIWGARQLGEIVPLPDSTREKMAADLQDAARHVAARRSAFAAEREAVGDRAASRCRRGRRRATLSLNARIATVFSSVGVGLDDAAVPQHVVDEDRAVRCASAAAARRSSSRSSACRRR